MGRRLTEIFGVLSEVVMNGGSNQDIIRLMVGDAGQSGLQDSSPFGQTDIGAGSELNRFDQIMAETGNVRAAVGATNQSVIDEIVRTGLFYGGGVAPTQNIERIKISEAANAAIETKDAIEIDIGEEASNTLDIERLFANAYNVPEADLIEAIKKETAITESENTAWGFDSGVPSSIAQGVSQSPYEAIFGRVTAPPSAPEMEEQLVRDIERNVDIEALMLQGGQQDVAEQAIDQQLSPFEAIFGRGLLQQTVEPDPITESPIKTAYDLYRARGGGVPPQDPGEQKEYDDAIWDKLPQLMYPSEPGKQTDVLSRYVEPGDAISHLLEELQKYFIDYEAYSSLMIDEYFKPHLDGILKSEIGQGTLWKDSSADSVLEQWAMASPISMTARTGEIEYLLKTNPEIRAWYDQSMASNQSPTEPTEPRGMSRKSGRVELEWWTNLPDTVQYMIMMTVGADWEERQPPGFRIRPPDGEPTTIPVEPTTILGEPPTPAIVAAQSLDPYNLAQIIEGAVPIDPPDLPPDRFVFLGAMGSQDTQVILHYDPIDKHVYAELGANTLTPTWRYIENSTLTESGENQVTLEIGPEGSGLTFTNYTYGGAFTPLWLVGDQTAASDVEIGLGALTGIPPISIGATFAGRPQDLWEAARTEQLGPKAHIPQYWKTRMHGFVPAWGRHLMRNSHSENFATYLSRPANQDPNQTATDWGLAVQASRALGTPASYHDVGANWEERVKFNSLKGILRSGKNEVMAMASAGLNITPDTYGGAAAYRQLSNMYDIFEQQEAGRAGDPGKFLALIDDLMSGEEVTNMWGLAAPPATSESTVSGTNTGTAGFP